MLKNINLYLMVLFAIFIITACGGEKVESQRLHSSIPIDGKSDDWTDYRQTFLEDWKAVYAIANDDTSISIMIQFREDQLAQKINSRGFTIWLNSEGDEEKTLGIHYEDRELMDRILNNIAEGNDIPSRQIKNSEPNKAFKFTGFFELIDKDKNVLSENGQNGIYAEVLYDKGNYCFEYKITNNANSINPDRFNLSLESDLKVGIEIAAVSEEFKEIMKKNMEEQMKNGMKPSGGKAGAGMRGGRRGGRMGGPPSAGRENMMKDLEAQEIWLSVELAK